MASSRNDGPLLLTLAGLLFGAVGLLLTSVEFAAAGTGMAISAMLWAQAEGDRQRAELRHEVAELRQEVQALRERCGGRS